MLQRPREHWQRLFVFLETLVGLMLRPTLRNRQIAVLNIKVVGERRLFHDELVALGGVFA
jgi:hypothetical protein